MSDRSITQTISLPLSVLNRIVEWQEKKGDDSNSRFFRNAAEWYMDARPPEPFEDLDDTGYPRERYYREYAEYVVKCSGIPQTPVSFFRFIREGEAAE